MKYKVVKCKARIKLLEDLVNDYAKKGWEVVSCSANTGTFNFTLIFKKK